MNSDLIIAISYASTALAAALAIAALIFKRGKLAWTLFALGMLLLAVESALAAALIDAGSVAEVAFWQKWKTLTAAFIPGTWLAFSLCYSRANYRDSLNKWRWMVAGLFLVPCLTAVAFQNQLLQVLDHSVHFGPAGKVVVLSMLAGSILILMNLERTFRSATGVMRWRIKYLVFGAGLFFGTKVYTASQDLLYSRVHTISIEIETLALLVASGLMAFSFFRTRVTESEIYPSQKVLQQSITVVVAGAYLVIVGGVAKFVTHLGGDPSFPVKAFVLMLAVVCLSVLVLSDRVQQRIKLFVGRHFNRPLHDHQKVWAACTTRTSLLLDPIDLSREVAKLVSETFELLSVTVWLSDDNRRSLSFGASTSLTVEQAAELLARVGNPEVLLLSIRALPGPLNLDTASAEFALSLRELDPDHFRQGGSRVCVPLLSGGEAVGFLTLADRVNGRLFSVEDIDLLTCIANQVAGTFRNLELSRTLIQNKEMQAFQAMSAFFVHDLRNSASTLSLMLKNLETHFGNPQFRDDCLRGLTKSVTHINDLIKRLTVLRQELDLKKGETDLNYLLGVTIKDLGGLEGLNVVKDFLLESRIFGDSEQLRKVITNLLLNAREAMSGHGLVRISTAQRDTWAVLTVADTGCGMTRDFINRSLFRPFQTTKKNGMGIGMFHTKAIVEAHRGRIEVESQPGQGTTFRILLPLQGGTG